MPTLLEEAVKEIGYTETPVNKTKFAKEAGHANGAPWCATFLVAMARRAHVQLPNESAYTPSMAQGFKNAGLWSNLPVPGSLVFYDFPDSVHRIQHVGVVESVDPVHGTLVSIEGNTSPGVKGSQVNGGGVYRRTRKMTYAVGYGHLAAQEPAPVPQPEPPIDEEEVLLWSS